MSKIGFFERIKKNFLSNAQPSQTQTQSTDVQGAEYQGSWTTAEGVLTQLTTAESNRNDLDDFYEELREKTTFEAWRSEFKLSDKFIKYFLSVISAIGAYYYFHTQFTFIPVLFFTVVIALTIVSLIAVLQHFILPKAANKLFKGAILASLPLLAISLLLSVVSVHSSVNGVVDLVGDVYDHYAPPEVKADIKADSMKLASKERKLAINDSLILVYMAKANVAKNTDFVKAREKENLTLSKEIARLQKRIDKAENKADVKTGEQSKKHETDKAGVKDTVFGVSLFVEFLILLVFMFIAWYKKTSLKELAILQANNLTIAQHRTNLKIVPLATGYQHQIAAQSQVQLPHNTAQQPQQLGQQTQPKTQPIENRKVGFRYGQSQSKPQPTAQPKPQPTAQPEPQPTATQPEPQPTERETELPDSFLVLGTKEEVRKCLYLWERDCKNSYSGYSDRFRTLYRIVYNRMEYLGLDEIKFYERNTRRFDNLLHQIQYIKHPFAKSGTGQTLTKLITEVNENSETITRKQIERNIKQYRSRLARGEGKPETQQSRFSFNSLLIVFMNDNGLVLEDDTIKYNPEIYNKYKAELTELYDLIDRKDHI